MLSVIRSHKNALFQDGSMEPASPMCAGRIDGSSRRKRVPLRVATDYKKGNSEKRTLRAALVGCGVRSVVAERDVLPTTALIELPEELNVLQADGL